MQTDDVVNFARSLQRRGRYREAARYLKEAIGGAGETLDQRVLEYVRVLLRCGDARAAKKAIDAIKCAADLPAGLVLCIEMEAQWLRCLMDFDLAGALVCVDQLWTERDKSQISAFEAAEANVARQRVVRAAAVYFEAPGARAVEALAVLDDAISVFDAYNAISEKFTAQILRAGSALTEAPDGYLALARQASLDGRPDLIGDALVRHAEDVLRRGGPSDALERLLRQADEAFQSAANELGQIDVARVQTLIRVDYRGAPLIELQDILDAYSAMDLPGRELLVIPDISVRYHQLGDLANAREMRIRENEVAIESGLLMATTNSKLAELDLLMREQRLGEAIALAEAVLTAPLPRVMLGNFEQFLGTAYALADDSVRARRHLERALAIHKEIGANDFASVTVTKLVNDVVTSRDERALRNAKALATEWAEGDEKRGDFEGATAKYLLCGQVALQLHRVPGLMTGFNSLLDDAENAANHAAAACAKLRQPLKARDLGNIGQLRGQISLQRNDFQKAETAYRASIIEFERAELGFQAANSRYIVGCMQLNASADATRAGNLRAAAEHFGKAEAMLKAALSYYDANSMRNEAQRAHRMVGRLYANGRAIADDATKPKLTEAALSHLKASGEAQDEMLHLGPPDKFWRIDLAGENHLNRDLALNLSVGDLKQRWSLHHEMRGRWLARIVAKRADLTPEIVAEMARTPELVALIDRFKSLSRDIARTTGAERVAREAALTELEDEMEQFPVLKDFLAEARGHPPSLERMQNLLSAQPGRGVRIVDWIVRGSQIQLVVTSANSQRHAPIDLTTEALQELISGWRHWPQLRHHLLEFEEPFQGFEPLLAPLSQLSEPGDHLVFCPSGLVDRVPLHALSVGGDCLISRNTASYAPSLPLLFQHLRSRSGRAIDDVTSFGDPVSSLGASLISRESAMKVAARFGVTADVGNAVARKAFTTALASGDLVHFQGHAELVEEDVERSRLRLSDGVLEAKEFIELGRQATFNARICILGACASGALRMLPGDEPMGLSVALLAAGVRSVCAPIWPVDEQDAADFMTAFYDVWDKGRSGVTLAEAVRSATLQLRERPGRASAYHWAPFCLTGDWRL